MESFLEEFSIDDLIEKIENAEKQSLKGETVSEVELEKEINKWFE